MVSETDKAYAAGLFDGEGSVCISYKMQHTTKSTLPTFSVRVALAMIDEPSVVWLVETFGGTYDQTNRSKSGTVIHRWTKHGRNAADFLEMVVPYLKLKRARAESAILLARMKRRRGATAGSEGVRKMTQEEVDAQRPLAEFIRAENMRSNPKISNYITHPIVAKELN